MAGLPFPEWTTFVSTVIEATRHEPAVMLPQVAWLVVNTSVAISGLQHDFDEAAAVRLFGDVETLLGLFRGEDLADWAHSPEVETVLAHSGTDGHPEE